MDIKHVKNELQHILQGTSRVSYGESIQAIASFLRKSLIASGAIEDGEQSKDQENEILVRYITENNLWKENINYDLFLSQGAEQRVYIKDKQKVFKLNDGIYYLSWVDYFYNLLLNNYFFPDTAYNLIGFYKSELDVVYAVVEQNYVESNQPTDLSLVKNFLENNGFSNTRNNDYYNADLGIILEDLHDEIVLTYNGFLYFIDTVFYIKKMCFGEKTLSYSLDR